MKRIVIYILLCIIIIFCIYFIFKIEIHHEKNELNTLGKVSEDTILPIPDRIIYKNQNDQYVIILQENEECQFIYNELYRRITNIIDGKVYTENEITKMQENGSFIEFDYNTKSKNFVFMLEEPEIGIIKRFTDSGQIITTTLSDKEDLIKKVENWTKSSIKYDFHYEKNYTVNNVLDELPYNLEVKEVKPGVYQEIIQYNELDYTNAIQNLGIDISENVLEFDSNKETVVITLSKYEMKNITQNIGNIKYEFGEYQDKYSINVLVVSKIVNTNCIYYYIPNANSSTSATTENLNKSNDECAAPHYIENNKYYSNFNNQKLEIISKEKACDIADMEAKNEKYQYQPWEAEFYSRGKDKKDSASVELILGLSEISKLYHWNEEWKLSDYENKLMWKVRLFDENDPLTNLYIYVDAINGNIIGAGNISD